MADATLPATRIRSTVLRCSGVNAAVGLWLFFSPFIFDYANAVPALWNDVLVGLAILLIAMGRTVRPLSSGGASWLNVVLGIWLLAAPFVLAYGAQKAVANVAIATWNDVVVGAVVVLLAYRSAQAVRRAAPQGRR